MWASTLTCRVLVAAVLVSVAQGFMLSPAATTSSRALQQRTAALPPLRMSAGEMDRRKMLITASGGLAAVLLGSRPAVADNLVNGRAACTTIDCPAPTSEGFELVDNIVKPNEYTGKGATFKEIPRPSQVQLAAHPSVPVGARWIIVQSRGREKAQARGSSSLIALGAYNQRGCWILETAKPHCDPPQQSDGGTRRSCSILNARHRACMRV
jgi:hypothetical protein